MTNKRVQDKEKCIIKFYCILVYFEYKEHDANDPPTRPCVDYSTETHFLLLFAHTDYLAVSDAFDFLTFEP